MGYVVKYSCPAVHGEGKHHYAFRAEAELLELLIELEKFAGYVPQDSGQGNNKNLLVSRLKKNDFLIEISLLPLLEEEPSALKIKNFLEKMPRNEQNADVFEIRTYENLAKLKTVLKSVLPNQTVEAAYFPSKSQPPILVPVMGGDQVLHKSPRAKL